METVETPLDPPLAGADVPLCCKHAPVRTIVGASFKSGLDHLGPVVTPCHVGMRTVVIPCTLAWELWH